MAQYAKRYGLLASCGSDYHGPEQSWQELGKPMPLPDGCVPVWKDWELGDVVSASTLVPASASTET
jgi:hypothetical protein